VHAADSAGISSIGSVTDMGGGVFTVDLTAGSSWGADRFRVTVEDGIRPVILMPDSSYLYAPPSVPSVSGLGYSAVAVLLASGGALVFRRRHWR
jgi:hypothetical protein